MESIAGRKRKWKKKVTLRRKALEDMMKLAEINDIDIKVSMIQALIPLGLEAVNENLQKEAMLIASKKHEHGRECC